MYQVFLADDEPWVLISLKNLIDWGKYGFVICGEATDGVSAWERIQRMRPNLTISDIRMPGIDGIELIKKMRQEELESEVVIISGYSDFEYARSGLKYGCVDYLIKPVDEEELGACLEKVKQKLDKKFHTATEKQEDQTGYLSENRVLRELLQYMKLHFQDVTQQQLSDLVGLSTSSISQIIRKKTGKSYSEYLLEIRIQKAQELLSTTNESIEEIANQVGYNDYFYFIKVFKKATGISPSSYRKNL